MHPYESLREKLVQPFLLLGFIVSAALSLITFGLLARRSPSSMTDTTCRATCSSWPCCC